MRREEAKATGPRAQPLPLGEESPRALLLPGQVPVAPERPGRVALGDLSERTLDHMKHRIRSS